MDVSCKAGNGVVGKWDATLPRAPELHIFFIGLNITKPKAEKLSGMSEVESRAGSREPRAESQEPRAKSRELTAKSREPRAQSREPGAGSREPRAEPSREPGPITNTR